MAHQRPPARSYWHQDKPVSNSSALSYGAFRNRYKQVTAGADPTTTIYVAGLLEKVTRAGVTEFRALLGMGSRTVTDGRDRAYEA
jgi:hypothetical protein